MEALRFICEQANNSRNADDITAVTTAGEQQLKLMNTLTDTLSSIADQKKEIQELRERINSLEEYINKNKLSWWQKLLKK